MQTVFKTYTHYQARSKQQAYELATGLKFDFYHQGTGYVIKAIATRETPLDENVAIALLPWLDREYRDFHYLATLSGLTLADVISGAKTLAQSQRAVPTVNRNGNFYAIRKA